MRLRLSVLCLCIVSGCASTTEVPRPNTNGVLFAYSGKALALPSEHACTVLRQGRITEQRGPKRLPTVERFALLRCSGDEDDLLANFTASVSNGAVPEPSFLAAGELNRLEENRARPQDAIGRAYVVKLSYLNGETGLAERDKHEDSIDDLALTRITGWRREARIYVDGATGIEQPDAVGVLYFRPPADRSEFRKTETDVVQEIGRFNKRHLRTYVYLYGEKD